jgi:hypothetical protein
MRITYAEEPVRARGLLRVSGLGPNHGRREHRRVDARTHDNCLTGLFVTNITAGVRASDAPATTGAVSVADRCTATNPDGEHGWTIESFLEEREVFVAIASADDRTGAQAQRGCEQASVSSEGARTGATLPVRPEWCRPSS